MHLFMLGIDRIDDTLETACEHVAQDLRTDRMFTLGGADDGDRLWFEDFLQIVFFHLVTTSDVSECMKRLRSGDVRVSD